MSKGEPGEGLPTFADVRLYGGRFNGHVMPIENLPELTAYHALLVDVAKALYREGRGRKRVPGKWVERLGLAVDEFVPGRSVTATLTRRVDGTFHLPDELNRAAALVNEAIIGAAEGGDLPRGFPEGSVHLFRQLGATLAEDEGLEIAPAGAKPAHYNLRVREQILSARNRRTETPGALVGWVSDLDPRSGRFSLILRRDQGTEVEGSYADRETFEKLKSAMKFPHMSGNLVRVVGTLRCASGGKPERFLDVEEVLLIESYGSARVRLNELRDIQPGWLDGVEGHPIAPDLARRVDYALNVMEEWALPLPRLYPTPEGGIQAEWSIGGWQASATFDPGELVEMHAVHVPTEEVVVGEFGADDLADLAAQLVPILRGNEA